MTTKGWGSAGTALLMAVGILLLSGCQGFAALDQPPVAKFTVLNSLGDSKLRVGERVVLDASGSKDPQGYALTYEWELKTAQQSLVRLSSKTDKIVWFYPDDERSFFYVSLRVVARSQSDVTELRAIPIEAIDSNKLRLTTKTDTPYDSYGTVEPWGVRALNAGETFFLSATPKKGYQFSKWIVSPTGQANIVDTTKASTSARLTSGPVIIQALFEPTATVPQFVGWKKAFPNGLAKVSGDTGIVATVGTGAFSGQMVSLARAPNGTLYGAGTPITNLQGVQLFVIDPVTGMAGTGVDFLSVKGATTVSSLAYTTTGTLYALDKVATPKLYVVDGITANLSAGVDLLLNAQAVPLKSLTYSPSDKTLLGTDGVSLYKVETTGVLTKIGPFGSTSPLGSLTSTKDGQIFAIDDALSPSIYSINPTTGYATFLVGLSTGLLSLLVDL